MNPTLPQPIEGKETSFITRVDSGSDSNILGVSVRAWIALLLTSTVCGMNLISLGTPAIPLEIQEPLYSGWLLSLGFYFGQKK